MQNFGEVLYNLPFDLKSKFRKLENNSKKLITSKWSIVFNETCLKENLLPIYSNIYICICFNRSTQYVDSFCAAVVIHNTGDASEPFAKSFKRLFFELF